MRNFTVGLSLVLLIGTAITIGNIHINENRNLQLIIDQQKEIIEQDVITGDVLRKEIDKLRKINASQNEELEKKNKQLELLHKEIEKLKKEKSPSVSVMPSRGEQPKRKLTVTLTAYTSFCSTGCIGKTKTGLDVSQSITHEGMRIIAVDPSVIKLHSIVRVDTEKESFLAYAADTGGRIVGHKVDLLISLNNTQKAFNFGKQKGTITILREGEG